MIGDGAHCEEVRTPRLILRRMQASDLAGLLAMDQDPRMMATLGGLRPEGRTREYLRVPRELWEAHGFGYWSLADRETGRFVGRGGLRHVEVGGGPEVEVGYALMPEFWGRGLATELAEVSVRVAFDRLGVTDLVGFTLPTNRASRNVLEKVGFRYERDIVHAGLPHVLYRLRASGDDGEGGS